MLHSMTGYGRYEITVADKTFLFELRSLNGKQFDMRLQLPAVLKPHEFDIRTTISEHLERGSVECNISLKQNGSSKPVMINTDLLKAYYNSVIQVADELKADAHQLLGALLRLPDVVMNNTEVISDEEWSQVKPGLINAINDLMEHRREEGRITEDELKQRIANIESHEVLIASLEPRRKVKIKENLVKLLEENVGKDNYDNNRLEQELIFYIEKIDITEEQVRLKNHCKYFNEILKLNDKSKGKKLSFVLQEIGREINTTGSKAYDADIQKHVVMMKDELEKAKEQILNVL